MKTTTAPRPVTATQFARMTPAKQRIAIANDVLARLRTKQLYASPGDWVYVPGAPIRDLQKLLKQKAECHVCALGAAVCGVAHFEDRIKLNDESFRVGVNLTGSVLESAANSRNARRLEKIFGKAQLYTIEFAFEGGDGVIGSSVLRTVGIDDGTIDRLGAFYDKHVDDNKRLRAIWQKVARHPEGRFVV